MSEVVQTYEVKNGKLVDDSLFVRQQVANYLMETTPSGLVLVGYESDDSSLEVPVEALKAVELFISTGVDVGQARACLVPELSLMAKRLQAAACFVTDSFCFLDSEGCYLNGTLPIRRIEKGKRGKSLSLDLQREYMRYLRKEVVVDRLNSISVAIAGLKDKTLFNLLSQVIPLRGLWRVRSDGEASVNSIRDSVLRLNANIGVKLDSTGTKAVFIADNGVVIKTEEAAALIARYLKEQGSLKEKVARDWNISRFFDKVAEKSGLKVAEEAVFHVGEEIIYHAHLGVGDGLWLTFLLCEIIAVTERPLSELIEEMHKVVGKRETKSINLSQEQLIGFLKRLTGKQYSILAKGEVLIDDDVVAWQKLDNNSYSVFLDGRETRLQSWLNSLSLDIFL